MTHFATQERLLIRREWRKAEKRMSEKHMSVSNLHLLRPEMMDPGWTPNDDDHKPKKKKLNQFMSVEVGNSLAGVDLSRIGKFALINEKSLFGQKPKVVVFFHDNPDTPAMNFELQSDKEARTIYKQLEEALNTWAEEVNSSKIQQLMKEIEVRQQEKQALIEQNAILMGVFEKFKEMMQIMEDETKTSELVATIKNM